jgi:hypothetical protein
MAAWGSCAARNGTRTYAACRQWRRSWTSGACQRVTAAPMPNPEYAGDATPEPRDHWGKKGGFPLVFLFLLALPQHSASFLFSQPNGVRNMMMSDLRMEERYTTSAFPFASPRCLATVCMTVSGGFCVYCQIVNVLLRLLPAWPRLASLSESKDTY